MTSSWTRTGTRVWAARAVWVPPAVGAVVLWALVRLICTPERAAHLMGEPLQESRPVPELLGWWVYSWSPGGGEVERAAPWLADSHLGAGAVAAQLLLTVALFAAGSALVLRLLPPTGWRWPLTWFACWWTGVVAALLGSAIAAPFGEGFPSASLAVVLGTGRGLPLLTVLALVASAAVTAAAWLLSRGETDRTGADTAPTADRGVLLRMAGAAMVPGALLIGALGSDTEPVFTTDENGTTGRLAAFWLTPAAWYDLEDGGMGDAEAASSIAGHLVLGAALQVLLLGALFWLVVRLARSRSLPALVVTGAWAGTAAGVLATSLSQVLGTADMDFEHLVFLVGRGGYAFVPGALTAGALGGAAAWIASRPSGTGWPWARSGGDAPQGKATEQQDGRGTGPEADDDLVITVRR
ncbi:hypothetical protein [Streptomyces sp. SM14]|uniref:hypothetical protein n=1 Tax=Streptomyces sp. SM14 TaxID=1736045 RepID=UPI0011B0BA7E|nr:hypothetical protein [Streptomyces sp. SM14]